MQVNFPQIKLMLSQCNSIYFYFFILNKHVCLIQLMVIEPKLFLSKRNKNNNKLKKKTPRIKLRFPSLIFSMLLEANLSINL